LHCSNPTLPWCAQVSITSAASDAFALARDRLNEGILQCTADANIAAISETALTVHDMMCRLLRDVGYESHSSEDATSTSRAVSEEGSSSSRSTTLGPLAAEAELNLGAPEEAMSAGNAGAERGSSSSRATTPRPSAAEAELKLGVPKLVRLAEQSNFLDSTATAPIITALQGFLSNDGDTQAVRTLQALIETLVIVVTSDATRGADDDPEDELRELTQQIIQHYLREYPGCREADEGP